MASKQNTKVQAFEKTIARNDFPAYSDAIKQHFKCSYQMLETLSVYNAFNTKMQRPKRWI